MNLRRPPYLLEDGREVIFQGLTIYDHPRDFPAFFVVRAWIIVRGGGAEPIHSREAQLFNTLEEARAYVADLPLGLVLIPRSPEDDPVITETWL